MLLCVDIGNTNITMGVYKSDTLVFTARMASDIHRTGDQYAVEIYDIIRLNGCNATEIRDAIISSVVPAITQSFENAVFKLCGFAPLVLEPGMKTGLNIKIDNPAQLGADLVAGAAGAISKYTLPCIIIDLGTATTLTAVNIRGEFIGGSIAAGIGLTLEALARNTAQLPSVEISAPKNAIGKNTIDSMKSGLVFGAAAMLDGMIDRFEAELGEEAAVVATGGLAPVILPFCKRKIHEDETLVLDGLKAIYHKNR